MDWNAMSDAAIVAEIGKKIKEYRTRKKFTQAQIAERTGLSVFTISQMEKGKNTSLNSFVAVLRVLKLLDNIELLIPKPLISPIELLQKQSKKR